MLSGDKQITAAAVARQVGIERVLAEVNPADKQHAVARLQRDGRTVAMVGDGINDAPALVTADLGIALGTGADVAIESADIVLVRQDLRQVLEAILLARATLRTIRQNLVWAFLYNLPSSLAAGSSCVGRPARSTLPSLSAALGSEQRLSWWPTAWLYAIAASCRADG